MLARIVNREDPDKTAVSLRHFCIQLVFVIKNTTKVIFMYLQKVKYPVIVYVKPHKKYNIQVLRYSISILHANSH